jgi:hypothetical protein
VLVTSAPRTAATASGSSGEWATPRSSENEQRTRKHQPSVADGHGKMLAAQVLEWPTATQRDWKDGACRDANVPTNGLLGRAVPRTTGSRRARLNPRWVESLQGFPIGWLRW